MENNWFQENLNQNSDNHQVYNTGDSNKYGSSYSTLVNANPYANVNYRKSWWQNVLQGLGFRTNYDAYMESMALQAKEYDASVAQKAYNEQYDSALSQVERQRAAGINPDLAGNVSAGDSSQMTDDGNPPVPPEADDFGLVSNTLQQLGAICINSVQMAFGFAKDFQSIRAMSLDNDAKRIANSSGLMRFGLDSVLNMIDSDFEQKDPGEVWSYMGSASDLFGSGLSKRQRKNYLRQVDRFSRSLTTWASENKLRDEGSSSRQNFFQRYYNDKTYSPIDSTMEILSRDFSSIVYDTWKSMQFRDKKQADFDFQSLDKTSPDLVGQGENARNEYDVFRTNLQKDLKGNFDKILKDLNHSAQNGNFFSGIVSMILSGFMMRYLGM